MRFFSADFLSGRFLYMIEQVLEEIKQAEEKALKIRTEADERVAFINKQAEESSARILSDAEEAVKAKKALYKVRTAEKVDKLYNEVIDSANRDVEALYNSKTAKIEELANEMVGKVLNGDC